MIFFFIVVFVVSWLLYCVVSIVVFVNGYYVFLFGEVEIFELMVKVFVIYNLFVYVFINGIYCVLLKGLFIGGNSVIWVNLLVFRISLVLSSYVNLVIINL